MAYVLELLALLSVRCFYVVQKQKGVADAMIEALAGTGSGVSSGCSNEM
jgi:hypothetical protein